jgi:hypothetical protein
MNGGLALAYAEVWEHEYEPEVVGVVVGWNCGVAAFDTDVGSDESDADVCRVLPAYGVSRDVEATWANVLARATGLARPGRRRKIGFRGSGVDDIVWGDELKEKKNSMSAKP